jgi:hypothetical protein
MSGGHYTLDELRAFATGSNQEGADALLEHCRACVDCGDSLAAMLLMAESADARRRRERDRRRLLLAAGALIVGALGMLLRSTDLVDAPRTDDLLAGLATEQPLPPAAVRIHLGVLSPAGTDDSVARLQAAGAALARGQYDAAIPDLEELHDRDPSSGVVAAYLGIALYLTGDNSSRAEHLLTQGAQDQNRSIATFTQWYLANLLLRSGQTDASVRVLETLAPSPTAPGRNAQKLLDEIRAIQDR